MAKTLFKFAISLLFVFRSTFAFQLPWAGVFEDTTIMKLSSESGKSFSSKTNIFGDYQKQTIKYKWIYYPAKSIWVSPQVNLLEERYKNAGSNASEWQGSIILGRHFLPSLDAELALIPKRIASGLRRNNLVAGGMGLRWKPLPLLSAYVGGKGIESREKLDDSTQYRNPGYAGEAAIGSTLPWVFSDSIRLTGVYAQDWQRRSNHFKTHARVTGLHGLKATNDSLLISLKFFNGRIKEQFHFLNEQDNRKSISVRFQKGLSEGTHSNVFWSFSQRNRNFYLTPLRDRAERENQIATHAYHAAGNWTANGLIGLGIRNENMLPDTTFSTKSEENPKIRRNLLDNKQEYFWAEGKIVWNPNAMLELEWNGYGRRHSMDYPFSYLIKDIENTKPISSDLDNDEVSFHHWGRTTFFLSPNCTTSLDAKYSEYIIQNLKAAYSGGNRTQSIYTLSPSMRWQLSRIMHITQTFGIMANYIKNPFSPSLNSLLRQLRTFTSLQSHLSLKDRLLISYDYRSADHGSIDSVGYYSIERKSFKQEYTFEWERRVFNTMKWKPGIGRIRNYSKTYDYATYSYLNDLSLLEKAWVYSLKIQNYNPYGANLFLETTYTSESTGYYYWDVKGIVMVRF